MRNSLNKSPITLHEIADFMAETVTGDDLQKKLKFFYLKGWSGSGKYLSFSLKLDDFMFVGKVEYTFDLEDSDVETYISSEDWQDKWADFLKKEKKEQCFYFEPGSNNSNFFTVSEWIKKLKSKQNLKLLQPIEGDTPDYLPDLIGFDEISHFSINNFEDFISIYVL